MDESRIYLVYVEGDFVSGSVWPTYRKALEEAEIVAREQRETRRTEGSETPKVYVMQSLVVVEAQEAPVIVTFTNPGIDLSGVSPL